VGFDGKELEGIDGFSVGDILRAQPSTDQVPVLVVTALGGQITGLNALSVGADAFLSKPFSPQELVRRVGEIFNAHAARSSEDESSAET